MGGEVLVLGIVGMLTWLIPFAGLPIPIIGLVWGIYILRKNPPRKLLAISGVILCSIGLFLSTGYSIITLLDEPSSSSNIPTHSITIPPYTPPTNVPWEADAVINDGEYKNQKTDQGYQLNWFNDSQYVYVGIQVTGNGWIGFGIQPNIQVDENIDLIIGYATASGVTVYDLFVANDIDIRAQDIALGGSNDLLEVAGAEVISMADLEEEEGDPTTIIEFKRKLDTGDAYDQPLVIGPNSILWMYGEGDSRDRPFNQRGWIVIEIE